MTNQMKNTILDTTWDKNVVPEQTTRQRGLMIELKSPESEQDVERRGVNLALVIDRSGSMGTRNMDAAKVAAAGVVENLGDVDVLSIVDFDTKITVLLDGTAMTPAGKAEAIAAINTLRSRGATAMSAGWFEGARCVADVMDRTEFDTGHIVLLSDGHANAGMTDPAELQQHAAELASRGITTSTVGIGNNYSPLQLDALAEGGGGRLHDAEGGDEIVEVLMGELSEARAIVANNVRMTIRWTGRASAELLGCFESDNEATLMTVHLGQMLSGSTRAVPLMFDIPGLRLGESIDVEIIVDGRAPQGAEPFNEISTRTRLEAVTAEESKAADRNLAVAVRIAMLWESAVGYEAMRLHEAGDLLAAKRTVVGAADPLSTFAADTPAESAVRRSLSAAEQRVSHKWEGRSKRESMIAAKKFSKGETDHRSDPKGNWSDHL